MNQNNSNSSVFILLKTHISPVQKGQNRQEDWREISLSFASLNTYYTQSFCLHAKYHEVSFLKAHSFSSISPKRILGQKTKFWVDQRLICMIYKICLVLIIHVSFCSVQMYMYLGMVAFMPDLVMFFS